MHSVHVNILLQRMDSLGLWGAGIQEGLQFDLGLLKKSKNTPFYSKIQKVHGWKIDSYVKKIKIK